MVDDVLGVGVYSVFVTCRCSDVVEVVEGMGGENFHGGAIEVQALLAFVGGLGIP